MDIIYEDKNKLIVYKPAGQLVQSAKGFELDLTSAVLNYRRKNGEPPYAAVINRLDRPVSGLVLYAKDKKEAARLSAAMQKGGFCKQYYAVVCGKLPHKNGTLVDYLQKDAKTNTSVVAAQTAPGSKRCELKYEVIKAIAQTDASLVKIQLITGRHHQIRVQFANQGCPLLGDTKYGGTAKQKQAVPQIALRGNEIALCACALTVDDQTYTCTPSWYSVE